MSDTSAGDGCEPPELSLKLNYLTREPTPRAVAHSGCGKALTSINQIARHFDVSATNFKRDDQRLSGTILARLMDLYGISFPSPCWTAFTNGTATAFEDAYEKLHKAGVVAGLPAHDSQKLTSAPQPRRTDRPLKQGPDRDIDRGPIRSLCSIELTCGNTGHGDTVVGVRIACGDAIIPVSPFSITVTAGRFEIDCGQAKATVDSCKGATGGARFDANGNSGVVHCKWDGDFKRPAWTLYAAGASIGTLVFEPGILAKIVDLAPGDVIKGTFGTWLKDIASDESAPPRIDDIAVVDRLGEQPQLPEQELSILQRKIIEHLRKSVLVPDAEGFAVISSHELQFIERTDT